MSSSLLRARRAAALAAVSAATVLSAAASPALAGPTVTLKYLCNYPLVDEQPLSITIKSDIPATVPAGTATNTFHISAVATSAEETRTALKSVKTSTIEGTAFSTASFSGPEANLTVNVPIPVPKYTLVTGDTGPLVLSAAGTTPPITLTKLGTSTITLKTLRLVMTARKADGTAILGLNDAQTIPATDTNRETFDVSCRLDPAAGTQSAVIGTVKVTAATDTTAPTVPGTPVAGAITSSSVALSWAASTDAKGVAGYNVYDNGERVAGTTGATSVTVSQLGSATSHSFTVRARDSARNVSADSAALTVATPSETKPTGTPVTTAIAPVTLTYSCRYPLVGAQSLSVKITTNIPQGTYAGAKLPKFNIGTVATAGVESYDALALVGATSIEGKAVANSSVRAPGFVLPVSVPVTVAKTTLPTTRGAFSLSATGTTPIIALPTAGSAKIVVDSLALNLTAKRADGSVIQLPSSGTDSDGDPNTFDVLCTLSPVSQSGLIGNVKVFVDSIVPTTPGTPVVSAITKSTATVSWAASTDNAQVTKYVLKYGSLTKTLSGTTLSTPLNSLTAITSYPVTVTAIDASGNSSAVSATTTFKTLAS